MVRRIDAVVMIKAKTVRVVNRLSMTRHPCCEALTEGVRQRGCRCSLRTTRPNKEVSIDCDKTVLCLGREAQLLQELHQNSTQCGAGDNTRLKLCDVFL